jgi:hypothetical protein
MIDHQSPRVSRRLRPKHVLVNYFASMTEPQSEVDIQGTLSEIASGLSADFATFGEPETRKELVDDFQDWTRRHLLMQVGGDPRRWMVSAEMARNFQAIADGFNRDLDPAEVESMKAVIRSVRRRQSTSR